MNLKQIRKMKLEKGLITLEEYKKMNNYQNKFDNWRKLSALADRRMTR